MKLSLERYGHETDIINEKLAELNHEQFIKILRLIEYDSKRILNHLVGIENDSEIKEKIDTLFTSNFNDLQFYKFVMKMGRSTRTSEFWTFQKHWLKYITMKTELEDNMRATVAECYRSIGFGGGN